MKLKGRGKKLNRKSLIKQHLEILSSLKFKSGLFSASKKTVSTGYDKAWLRDNFYECIAFEVIDDWDTVKTTYRAILEIFKKHEFKIDELESVKKIKILENEDDFRVVQKLVDYLSTLEYWHDPDSGMWEENEEVHASSVGACVAGLEMIKNVKGIYVNEELIKKGYDALEKLLPRESEKKFVDLALLSLIWPYDVLNKKQTEEVLKNIEYHLLKKKGVIRYKGDHYYNKNLDNFSEEAEWTFGLSWLSIIYDKLGKRKKAKDFLEKAIGTINEDGEVPELYFSNSDESNANSPLGWSESLFITALYHINKGHIGMKEEKLKKVVKKK